ncbi:Protein of unknown function [Lentibacillus persicus]|uniref:DUF3231 family protein n=1 Tax=Lentibacillus persicus TaxID=640948 RepID=A0A1I1SFN0_9BACI|nr:DUF3231 family protein [Lentibacillus persicus]SFD45132.1 Protein of unknown function [Lentibacillus persicus]
MASNNWGSENDKKFGKQISEHQQNLKLNSAELSDLWSNYIGDSMFICIFEHFLEHVEDDEIKDLLLFNDGISKRHVNTISAMFVEEGIPVPTAFGTSDIYKNTPRLFDDTFMLFYIQQMAIGAFGQYSRALSSSIRQDVLDFYRQGIQELNEVFERSTHLLLDKGFIMKQPRIPYPTHVEFIDKKSFNNFITGKSRPLAGIEMKYLNLNIATNVLGKAIMMAFAQTASSQKLRNYFKNGWELSDKQIKQYRALLESNNIPAPMTMDPYITDSKVPVFSDKLMTYHVLLANQLGVENLGIAMSRTIRHDISAKYAKFIGEAGLFTSKALDMMVQNGWLEQPPLAFDRNNAVKNPEQ